MQFILYTILTFLSHQHLYKISLLCVSSLLVPQMLFVKTVMVFLVDLTCGNSHPES